MKITSIVLLRIILQKPLMQRRAINADKGYT